MSMTIAIDREVTYEMLAGPTLQPLRELLDAMGEPQWVNPALVIAFVAKDNEGNIVGHVVLQSVPLAEPMKADPGWGFTLKPLFEMAQNFILESGAKRVIMHTEYPKMAEMLEKAGAFRWPVSMFQWLRK